MNPAGKGKRRQGAAAQRTRAGHRPPLHRRQDGSLLAELGMVLAVFGVLAVAAGVLLSSGKASRQSGEERQALNSVEQALRAFMLAEKRLPCPDLQGNGLETLAATGGCADSGGLDRVGLVPHASLHIDKPLLSGGRSLRYGVWRQPGADLAVRTAALPAGQLDADGSQRWREAALAAAASTDTAGQPYVAARDADGRLTDCGSASSHPAVVVAVSTGTGGGSTCFADAGGAAATAPRLLAIGRPELLGWLQANLR